MADHRLEARRGGSAVFTGHRAIPDPLDDPMRGLRTFFLWLMVIELVIGVVACFAVAVLSGSVVAVVLAGVIVLPVVGFTASVWRILPNRETDVLYLRSFRYDRASAGVRTDLQRAFGRAARVSGIRDPRRRWPKLLRYPLLVAFALRYATPKYMNLEAGDAWKERLWRSLGRARGAVIDVTDLTPHVIGEIRLCVRCLGLDRVQFVGNETRSESEWQSAIIAVLGRPVRPDQVRVAIWNRSRYGRREFRRRIGEFAAKLPADTAGLHDEAGELDQFSVELRGIPREQPGRLWVDLLLGFVVSFAVLQAVGMVERLGTGGKVSVIVLLTVVAFWLIQVWYFLLYLKDCGSGRERLLSTVTIGLALLSPVILVGLLLPAVQKVQEQTNRMQSSNNLKQVGLAFYNYHDANRMFPPAAIVDDKGKKLLSWRVQILPHIEQETLYKQFKLDEPWDSDHNKKLIEKMPKVYRHPMAGAEVPAGHTHYRVFLSPRNAAGPSAIFRDGSAGRSLVGITDGTSKTILVVEAAEAVPWTKPEGLPFDAGKPLPKLGGLLSGGFLAGMGDGSVRFYRDTISEATLRAYITADGGEVIRDD